MTVKKSTVLEIFPKIKKKKKEKAPGVKFH
jgi:hypothetical protein